MRENRGSMKKTMKALVLVEPFKLALQKREVPVPGATEVLIRVVAAGICHTDFLVMKGKHSLAKYPLVLGHEFSGIVEQCGRSVQHVKPGDRVIAFSVIYCGICPPCRRGLHTLCHHSRPLGFSMVGAYQEMICLPGVIVYPFGESLNFTEAALIEPAANAYSAAERATIYPGEHVVIIGPGPIGLLALQAAKFKHPRTLTVLGTRLERLQVATQLGATQAINVRETDPYDTIMEITGNSGADVVLLCAGTEDAWGFAGRILAPNGRIVVEATPSGHDTYWPVPVFDFTAKAISYLGVNGYTAAQLGTVLELVQSKKINVLSLVTHRFSLEEYKDAFETSDKRKDGAIKVIFEI